MISIAKASAQDAQLLSEIAIRSFIESHGHSADPAIIDRYINERYNPAALGEELSNTKNVFHIIYYNDRPAGYSKIIFNTAYEGSSLKNLAKLERIYILQAYYDKKIGLELFQFNVELAKANGQKGFWLFVWKENHRAVKFYTRNGFLVVGSYNFKLSETHSNPNHVMLLEFD